MEILVAEIDLTKGEGHHHPDIKAGEVRYLALIDHEIHFGTFSEQWYGWNFDTPPYQAGLQYDQPGTNSSRWQKLWELQIVIEEKHEECEGKDNCHEAVAWCANCGDTYLMCREPYCDRHSERKDWTEAQAEEARAEEAREEEEEW